MDAATHLTWSVASKPDDMKGVEDAGGVLELVIDGVLAVPGRDPASRFAPPHGSLLRALLTSSHARCQTFLGPGPLKRAVGWSFPRVRSTMPVSSRGPRRRRSWWCHTCSSTPSTRTPAKRAGSSDAACRHGLMWDHTVFHVVASCRARSDGGSLEAQLSDRPADRPGAQTRPGCAHPLVMFQECHRLAGVFAAYPASLKPPEPCRDPGPRARRSPPPRARGLERLSPQRGHPASWLHDSTSSTRASGVRAALIALQTDEQITPITPIKRRTAAAGRVRHRPRSFEDRRG